MIRLFQQFLEFLFPRRCLECNQSGTFLCQQCLQSIPTHAEQHCPVCQRPAPLGAICKTCPGWELDGLFVIAPYSQKSLLQTCVKTMKYRSAHSLCEVLGKWMAAHWMPPDAIIVPVPLHSLREKSRGYNQANLLARQIKTPRQLLKRTLNTDPQAGLSRKSRLKNLRNSFKTSAQTDLLSKKIVLVDDVCSTGATLNECAKTLRAAGAMQIWGLVLARG
jgi:ComF family protein